MNAYEQNGQKRFESGSVTVSYFPHIAPNTSSKLSVQQKVSDLETKLNQPQEIPLNDALHKGDEFQKELSTCRSIQDKDERNRYKRKHLGAYSVSGTFWTRDKDVPLEVKIKKYNSLMALDFDDEKDLEGLRNDLENLPWVYYAGLSASGKGMFALVPLDTDDYRMHKTFFEALKAEMESLGHKIDKNCSDVTRLRLSVRVTTKNLKITLRPRANMISNAPNRPRNVRLYRNRLYSISIS